MELAAIAVLIIVGLCGAATLGLLLGVAVGFFYGAWYWDGSERGVGRSWPAFRALSIWRWTLHAYWRRAPVALHALELGEDGAPEGIVPQPGPLLLAHRPHGLFPVGVPVHWGCYGPRGPPGGGVPWLDADKLRDAAIATTRLVMATPIVRDVALWLGCIDAGWNSLTDALRRDRYVHIMPGGVREGMRHHHHREEIYAGHEVGGVGVWPGHHSPEAGLRWAGL